MAGEWAAAFVSQISRARTVAFDGSDVAPAVSGQRHGEQPDAGVEIGHGAIRHLLHHTRSEIGQEIPVALEERLHVMRQRRRAGPEDKSVGDVRRSIRNRQTGALTCPRTTGRSRLRQARCSPARRRVSRARGEARAQSLRHFPRCRTPATGLTNAASSPRGPDPRPPLFLEAAAA